jgi:methylenetetrahydrofolate dehydrogenase (NADP+)/methenyltetrahydrofolate cyclohydrolase
MKAPFMAENDTRARIIDGKAFAAGLVERVTAASSRLKAAHGVVPGLAVVIVGEDPASQIYVRNKGERTREPGCAPTPIACPRPRRRMSCWP